MLCIPFLSNTVSFTCGKGKVSALKVLVDNNIIEQEILEGEAANEDGLT